MEFRQIRKVGRSNALFIPKQICEQVSLQPYDTVAVFVQPSGVIVLKKVHSSDLSHLLEKGLETIHA